jgi:hypothetical protein
MQIRSVTQLTQILLVLALSATVTSCGSDDESSDASSTAAETESLADVPTYQNKEAVERLKKSFDDIQKGLAFLQATTKLTSQHAEEAKALAQRVLDLREKYSSPATELAWASAQSQTGSAANQANALDKAVAEGNPYRCLYQLNGENRSSYVEAVDESFRAVKMGLFVLEKWLPVPEPIVMPMISEVEKKQIEGPPVICELEKSKEPPRYQDPKAVKRLSGSFDDIYEDLGFLGSLKRLRPEHSQEAANLSAQVDNLKKKYSSEYTDAAWAQSAQYFSRGKQIADRLEQRLDQLQGPTDTAMISYNCTTGAHSTLSDKTEWRSDYVDKLNLAFNRLKLNVYRLEKQLPEPESTGMLMLTACDLEKIHGPDIKCIPPKKAEKTTESPQKSACDQRKRVAPYSKSGDPMHDSVCQMLDQGVPPPFNDGDKCLYNYEQ